MSGAVQPDRARRLLAELLGQRLARLPSPLQRQLRGVAVQLERLPAGVVVDLWAQIRQQRPAECDQVQQDLEREDHG